MITDTLENWSLYFSNAKEDTAPSPWQFVFDYLAQLPADADEMGMTPLAGDDIKASIARFTTVTPDESVLEAHDTYIDIHVTLAGTETLAWSPRNTLEVKTPYNPDSDAIFFHPPANPAARIENAPGTFTIFFPNDAHMPQLHPATGCNEVKKVVMKLRADLVL